MSREHVAALFGPAAEADAELNEALRDSVRAFARRTQAQAGGDAGERRARELAEIAQAGWFGLIASEAHGGAALPVAALVALYEALGRWGVTANYATLGVLGLIALELCEARPVGEELIAQLVDGSARPVLCWQQVSGADERDIVFAPAVLTGEAVSVSLRSAFVEFADLATHFLFPVELHGRAGLLVVGTGAPGLHLDFRPSLSGGPIATVSFEGAVSDSGFLPLAARGELTQAFVLARIAAAAHLTGLVENMLELTADYTAQRVQFGKPIAANQAVQHRLVDMWGQKELARVVAARAGAACSDGVAQAELAACAAKARAAAAAQMVTTGAFQLHGAIGYTGEYVLGDLARACLGLVPWLGGPTAMRRRFVELERQANQGSHR